MHRQKKNGSKMLQVIFDYVTNNVYSERAPKSQKANSGRQTLPIVNNSFTDTKEDSTMNMVVYQVFFVLVCGWCCEWVCLYT